MPCICRLRSNGLSDTSDMSLPLAGADISSDEDEGDDDDEDSSNIRHI